MSQLISKCTAAPTGQHPQKLSLLSTLKSTLLCCTSGSKDDAVCHAADKSEQLQVAKSSVKSQCNVRSKNHYSHCMFAYVHFYFPFLV